MFHFSSLLTQANQVIQSAQDMGMDCKKLIRCTECQKLKTEDLFDESLVCDTCLYNWDEVDQVEPEDHREPEDYGADLTTAYDY